MNKTGLREVGQTSGLGLILFTGNVKGNAEVEGFLHSYTGKKAPRSWEAEGTGLRSTSSLDLSAPQV